MGVGVQAGQQFQGCVYLRVRAWVLYLRQRKRREEGVGGDTEQNFLENLKEYYLSLTPVVYISTQ